MTQYHGPRLKPLGVMAKSCFSCFRLYWNDHTWFIFIYFQTKRFPSKLLGLKWCPEARGSSHVKKFEFWNFHLLGAVPPLPDWLWQCHLSILFGPKKSNKWITIVQYYLDFSKNALNLKWLIFLSMHAATLCIAGCYWKNFWLLFSSPFRIFRV